MSSGEPRDVLRPSLFERLVGDDPGRRSVDLRVGVRELRAEVRRDLERLLNSRTVNLGDLTAYPEATASILGYGLPDLSACSQTNVEDAKRICGLIEDAVRRHEPRLDPKSVRVEQVAPAQGVDTIEGRFNLRFKIAAMLHVEPIHEAVRFDTSLEFDTGSLAIEEVG